MRKKKKKAVIKRPAMTGFAALFKRELLRYILPTVAYAATLAVSMAVVMLTHAPAAYAVFYVLSVLSVAVMAGAAVRGVIRDVNSCSDALSCVAEGDRPFVRSRAVSAAKCLSVLIFSALNSFVIFAFSVAVGYASGGNGEYVTWSAVAATAILAAAYYAAMLCMSSSALHEQGGKHRRRRIIFGTAALYAVGFVALLFIMACFSGIPLGEDMTGFAMPAKTALGVAVLYLIASLLRSVYLYFILTSRLSRAMKLKS